MPEDKIKQEIEQILDQLDTFLPEDKQPIPFRKPKRSPARGVTSALRSAIEPLTRFSLRQLMLTALILLGAGLVTTRIDSVRTYGQWLLIAGVILFLAAFALSVVNRRGGGSPSGPAYEKRWRGRPLDLDEPGGGPRRWFRPKR